MSEKLLEIEIEKTVVNHTQNKEGYNLSESGSLQLSTIEEQSRFAKMLIDKRLISETFKDPSQVILAIQTCKALNLSPIIGLKMMYVVGGKAALYGDGPLSLIQSSGQLESIEEFYFNEKFEKICFDNKNLKDEVYGACCRMKRKGDPVIYETTFTKEDRKKAMLNSPVWGKYERDMMKYRARGANSKAKFPDILNGLEIAEYTYQDMPQAGMISNDQQKLNDLNEKFKE